MRAVVNASPLIFLALLGHFSLLHDLFDEVFIPDAIYEEVVVQGVGQPGAGETEAAVAAGWLNNFRVSPELYRRVVDA